MVLESYYDEDALNYHQTIQSVSNQLVLDTHERDLTPWLNFFVKGFLKEAERVKNLSLKISMSGRVKDKLGEDVELNERQMMIIEYLNKFKKMQNKDFRKIFPDFSDDTVLREMRALKQKGIIKKLGGTKKATYILN